MNPDQFKLYYFLSPTFLQKFSYFIPLQRRHKTISQSAARICSFVEFSQLAITFSDDFVNSVLRYLSCKYMNKNM